MGMNPTDLSGFVLDPTKCSGLSLTEKRELVHEIAQWTKDAPVILSSFTRKELLQIICAELGEERKYSGSSKSQMIDRLLKLVNKGHKRSNADIAANDQAGFKRQRQKDPQVLFADLNVVPLESMKVCENAACRANFGLDDVFCKRCSCCICYRYDDNKDPSLWLTCGSDSAGDDSCGFTCHLICALKDGRSGIMNAGSGPKLDGSFCCVSCGKINGLMGTWKKQLLIAKDARRVDVLCLRVLLGFRILTETEKYKEMLKSMETAMRILVNELGPSDLVSAKMARGIVSRLSCGADVQKLCADALEAYDLMSSRTSRNNMEKKDPVSCHIQFEESSPTSVVLVFDYVDPCGDSDYLSCKLWHRKSSEKNYPEIGIIVIAPEKRFKLTGLSPATEYFFKASLFNSCGVFGTWEAKWITSPSNGSSITSVDEQRNSENTTTGSPDTSVDEQRNQENTATDQIHSQSKAGNIKITSQGQQRQKKSSKDTNKKRNDGLPAKRSRNDRMSTLPLCNEGDMGTSIDPLYPLTPCKANEASELSGCTKGKEESAYDYSVRIMKWLEQKGHIKEDFRVKFLTWFSLKASTQERRVVNAFVDCFIDDPPSLAGQLMHAFMDEICTEQKKVPPGFCYRLWH